MSGVSLVGDANSNALVPVTADNQGRNRDRSPSPVREVDSVAVATFKQEPVFAKAVLTSTKSEETRLISNQNSELYSKELQITAEHTATTIRMEQKKVTDATSEQAELTTMTNASRKKQLALILAAQDKDDDTAIERHAERAKKTEAGLTAVVSGAAEATEKLNRETKGATQNILTGEQQRLENMNKQVQSAFEQEEKQAHAVLKFKKEQYSTAIELEEKKNNVLNAAEKASRDMDREDFESKEKAKIKQLETETASNTAKAKAEHELKTLEADERKHQKDKELEKEKAELDYKKTEKAENTKRVEAIAGAVGTALGAIGSTVTKIPGL